MLMKFIDYDSFVILVFDNKTFKLWNWAVILFICDAVELLSNHQPYSFLQPTEITFLPQDAILSHYSNSFRIVVMTMSACQQV